MAKYDTPRFRICPWGVDRWSVEMQYIYYIKKVSFFRRKEIVEEYPGTWEFEGSFDTEKDAEAYIDNTLKRITIEIENEKIAAERQKNIPPRGYP